MQRRAFPLPLPGVHLTKDTRQGHEHHPMQPCPPNHRQGVQQLPTNRSQEAPKRSQARQLQHPKCKGPRRRPTCPKFSHVVGALSIYYTLVRLPTTQNPLLLNTGGGAKRSGKLLCRFPNKGIRPKRGTQRTIVQRVQRRVKYPIFPIHVLAPMQRQRPRHVVHLVPFLYHLRLYTLPQPLRRRGLKFFSHHALRRLP